METNTNGMEDFNKAVTGVDKVETFDVDGEGEEVLHAYTSLPAQESEVGIIILGFGLRERYLFMFLIPGDSVDS